VTCFIGAPEYDIPKDTEAAEVWQRLFASKNLSNDTADIGSEASGYQRGIEPGERIFYYDGSKNWWSRNGAPETTPVGDPCGPDSEMFYDFGTPHNPEYGEHCHPNCDCGRFMEIGNNVFMAYRKVAEGKFEELEQKNIDHGSGLERIAAARLNDPDVFKISLMWPIIAKLEELSGKKYESHTESMRVIADHLRAATFLAVDGCVPSNKQQGYVMRRLVRRAIRFAFDLGVEQNFMEQIVPVIADLYHDDFPEVAEKREEVIAVLVKEEKAFRQTLRKGLKYVLKAGKEHDGIRVVSGEEVFIAYDTYGYPPELTQEIIAINPPISDEELATSNKLSMVKLSENWREEFDAKMAEQRARSQTAAKGTFKGGLGGQDLIHKKYHTATHLLQSALRQLYGSELRQHGSNITEERLRFDFNLDRKMTDEEIKRAEELVNGWIAEDLPVKFTEYPTQTALDMGAIGPFGERYGETVKVYQMGPDDHIVSLEICGGPHVEHTGQLAEGGKTFKIIKEESSSAGIRRIKAVLA
jgi:alanyl-tRNA synthetase